jgi:hypothetical protein
MSAYHNSLKRMVDVAGIEPATPCLQRLVARRINNLAGMSCMLHKRARYFIAR